MNSERILKAVGTRYGPVTETSRRLYRALRTNRDHPLAVYYFDLSQEAAQPEFDIRAYTQRMIATDFYNNEGSLQWNYYLYIVLEADVLRNIRANGLAATIEKDRTFARKFVFDEDSLVSELSTSLGTTLRTTPPDQDIASQWFKKLTDAGLGQITDSSADYKPIIEDFLAGKPMASAAGPGLQAPSASPGRFIRSLDLGNFRPHPRQRQFDFGKVNLLRGVNGVGKTSVLEAIELCICGGLRRQGGHSEDNAELNIHFEGQTTAVLCPSDSKAEYRARDRAWYGGYYLQGNRLFENFARFNFFDTDAATKLSLAPTAAEVGRAIDTLFLGEFANTLEVRMTECKQRFEVRQREATRFITARRADAKKANDDLIKIRGIKDTREALLTELINRAKACGWKHVPSTWTLSEIARLHQAATASAQLFADALKRIPWLGRLSLSALRNEEEQLTATLTQLQQLREAEEKSSANLTQDQKRLAQLEAELAVLDRLQEYHAHPEAIGLLRSKHTLTELRQTQARFRDAAAKVKGLALTPFKDSNEPIQDLVALNASKTAASQQNLAALQSRASELQRQLGQIRSIVEEIKGLGARYCEVNPTGKECPLCGSTHDDLRARIGSLIEGLASESQLSELTAQIARNRTELTALRARQDALGRIADAAQLIFPASSDRPTVASALVERLSRLPELQLANKSALEAHEMTERRLTEAGFSAGELNNLLDSVESVDGPSRDQFEHSDRLQHVRAEKLKAAESLRETVKARLDLRKTREAGMRTLRSRHLGEKTLDEPDVELERRLSTLENVVETIQSPGIPIDLREADEFATHAAQLSAFASTVARIQDAFKKVEEKDALEKSISLALEAMHKEIDAMVAVEVRATAAIDLLNELLGSSYKDAYLQKVRADHKDKLTTVFLQIHAPHEFKDIHLTSDLIVERQTGILSEVTEISTGQRAALALSIFLGLNSSVAGRAPWILFDDPIVHIDDLNVVSFLDMLRELVLLGDRQIFFATANSRVGDLFARKFDFLGDQFKDFRLQR